MLDFQKKLVQESWIEASADKDLFIATLYDIFFDMTPRSRLKFKRNLKLHSKNIVAMIESIIERLNTLDKIMPELIPSGARHKDYLVTPEEFEHFRIALLKTIEHFLEQKYTDELEEAWNVVYRFMSSTMCSAMRVAPNHLSFEIDSFSRP